MQQPSAEGAVMHNNQSNTFLALLAGLAIGAGLGVLFAPESGERTRRKIKAGVEDYGDELKSQLKDLNDNIRSTLAHGGEQIADEFDTLVSDANDETEQMIAKLEARLGQLKDHLAQLRK
jgi:gas vesicle protein